MIVHVVQGIVARECVPNYTNVHHCVPCVTVCRRQRANPRWNRERRGGGSGGAARDVLMQGVETKRDDAFEV